MLPHHVGSDRPGFVGTTHDIDELLQRNALDIAAGTREIQIGVIDAVGFMTARVDAAHFHGSYDRFHFRPVGEPSLDERRAVEFFGLQSVLRERGGDPVVWKHPQHE
jgi:hypothetical protein